MIKKEVIVKNESGLHSRAAVIFIQHTNKYKSNILITKENSTVNAKSIMGVMALSVGKGESIEIKADGPDEKDAVDDLINLIENELITV
jgi:Phosphotransferase System HPr (HPr) Family